MFDQIIGNDVSCHPPCKNVVQSHAGNSADAAKNGAAFSNHIMRAGKHYALFKRAGSVDVFGGQLFLGVIRPIDFERKGFDEFRPWDAKLNPVLAKEKCDGWGRGNVDYCAYHQSGTGMFGDWNNVLPEEEELIREWPGKDVFPPVSFDDEENSIGLLLDLDKGTLSVYKNGRRLGVMKEGLTGDYCWFVMVRAAGVQMERAAFPL